MVRSAILTSGGGFNILIGASRLGMPVAYAGRVGDGPMGTQIISDLSAASIPLLLPRVSGEDSGFDVGLVEADAERTFVTSPGTESRLRLDDLRALELRAGDAVYVSGYDLCYPISGAALGDWLPALDAGVLLILDPGPLVAEIPAQRLERVLARTDIVSLNAREARILTGAEDLADAAGRLVPRLASGGWVVARSGAQGSWLASAAYPARHIPARPVQAVDTTGAGDAHVAALLARLAVGDDMHTAVHVANVAASIAVTRSGPATGPTIQELEAALL